MRPLRTRKYLLTFGIAVVLIVGLAVFAGNPEAIGYLIGRGVIPTALGAIGFFWRRRPVLGYWMIFALVVGLMAVGGRA